MGSAPEELDCDVAVIGDGPAGTALAAEATALGVDAVLVGESHPWTATYGVWADEVHETSLWGALGDSMFTSVDDDVVAFGAHRHQLGRRYGIVDNAVARAHLRDGVRVCHGRVHRVHPGPGATEVHGDFGVLSARWVVDATGAGSALLGPVRRSASAWQTAVGVVLDQIPAGALIDADQTVLMDFRRVDGPEAPVPTFCYVVRVADGWLVEETVLSASVMVGADVLRARLINRLGGDPEIVESARRTEHVSIPMDAPGAIAPTRASVFGAAAGYVHPATGFSVGASLRAAPRVAVAIAAAIDGGPDPTGAVWTRSMRATRRLHRYGAAVLAGLDDEQTRAFFDVFFDRPAHRWAPYLQLDAQPGAVMSTMAAMFAAAPWSLRRSMVAVDPRRALR